ncbi:MAG TPA: chloride channel protein, partial [Propionibacteriaceae bacterium]|nr:chloride channel protein [Propionibacteriaceae bacterium]
MSDGPDPKAMGRVRTPAPLIKRRIPSARGATEQPNAVGDGEAPLTLKFWLLVVVTGVATGLLGVVMMILLKGVETLAFGDQSAGFLASVQRVTPLRRIVVLVIGGIAGGVGWYVIRRYRHWGSTDVDDEVWTGHALLSFRRSFLSGSLSEVVVGSGASLGREAAPKLLGAAAASLFARWSGLSLGQRRLLVACGAGAGMGAVYNVPLGGALITAELLYGSLALPAILPALATSGIATVVAWVYFPIRPTYANIPAFPVSWSHIVFALVCGPLIGVVAAGYVRLIGLVSHHQLKGKWVLVGPAGAFAILGVLAVWYPELLGNGQDVAE